MTMRITKALAAVCLCAGVCSAQPSFVAFDPLPGDSHVDVEGVSADGTTVLMTSTGTIGSFGMRQLAVWRRDAGHFIPEGLNLRNANTHVDGFALSADGSVITGWLAGPTSTTAFRWSPSGGYQALAAGSSFLSTSISADGAVVPGWTLSNSRAAYWSQPTGLVTLPNTLGGSSYSNAASGDGSVIVGGASFSSGPITAGAFRWSAATGMTDLGHLPGATSTTAWGVSGDGSVVVGRSGNAVFRWTAQGGMVQVAEGSVSNYVRITPDGGTILANVSVPGGIRGMLWDEVQGRRDLAAILPLLPGFDASQWSFITPVDISADGMTIVGDGRDSAGRYKGFMATIPGPSSVLGLCWGLVLARRRRTV